MTLEHLQQSCRLERPRQAVAPAGFRENEAKESRLRPNFALR